jgi:hypothetical protein
MVAYSFKRRFVHPIEIGRKPHTLRGPRRRHARVGEVVQLYEGMRTRYCRLIAAPLCEKFHGVYLKFSTYQAFYFFDVVEQVPGEWKRIGDLRPIDDPDRFAYSDGFDDIDDMGRFWRDVHSLTSWDGFLIGWPALKAPAQARDEAA